MGGVAAKCKRWKELTGDPWILEMVRGVRFPLLEQPYQMRIPFPFKLGQLETCEAMDRELEKLLTKGVIEPTGTEQGQFVSNVFHRPKANG